MPQLKISETAIPRIQSLARADAILSEVMAHNGPIGLGVLSECLNLNKTTAYNLAESLVVVGLLERSVLPKGYKLGLRCLELGRHVTRHLPILEISRPYLREICQITRETVNLAAPYLHEGIILEALQSQHGVRATAYSGAKTNYHSSACGKAMLAYFSEDHRRWFYNNVALTRFTEFTICDPISLEADLEVVRRIGFATDQQENELGAYCVGMPIFGPFNDVVGSISVSGVIQRMTPNFVNGVVNLLRHKTEIISNTLSQT